MQSIIVARALGVEGKGIVTLGILLPSTAILLIDAGFTSSNIYFSSRSTPTSLLRNAFMFVASASGILIFLFLAVRFQFGIPGALTALEFVAVLALIPTMMLVTQLGALQIGLGAVLYANLVAIVQAVLTFVLTGLAIVLDLRPAFILLAVVFSGAVGSALLIRGLMLRGASLRLGWDRSLLSQQVRFGLRDHPGNLVQFLNYRLDQFILAGYLGTGALGIYSVSVAMAEVLWMIPQAAAVLLFARVSHVSRDLQDRGTTSLLRWVMGMCLVGGIILALFGRQIITVLYHEEFVGAYDALLLLLPGTILLGPAKVLSGEIAGRGHPGLNSITAIVGVAITVGMDVVLIPRYGIRGAASASSVAYSVVAAMSWYWYRRLQRQRAVLLAAVGMSE